MFANNGRFNDRTLVSSSMILAAKIRLERLTRFVDRRLAPKAPELNCLQSGRQIGFASFERGIKATEPTTSGAYKRSSDKSDLPTAMSVTQTLALLRPKV